MMPHPERCVEEILGGRDGIVIFQSIINYLKGGMAGGKETL
jgi:phosphoribosylformylglycinamidine synthase